jgi:membrane-bound lytic murein transglycosylase D
MNQRRFFLLILLSLLLSACTHLSADLDQPSDSNNTTAAALQSTAKDEKPDSNTLQIANGSTDAGNGEIKTDIVSETDTSGTQKVQTDLDEALELCELSQDYWQQGELENAVEALDRAYALILSVDTSDQPKLIQQKEDLRFMISKRILEIYASRNIVVNGNHNAIPLVVNRHVQAEIKLFTKGGERRFFIESLQRSGRYRDRMVSALKDAGLPEELSWLPLIESGFKAHALSRSRALGLWQFIPSTGYKFGLHRNKFIDERMDPAKATRAAIDYLKELHSMFGDWSTVLAAYNCGEGRVLRVIRSQNINYLDNFWDLYEKLPRETARYVPRFLATLHVLNNLEMYGLDQVVVDQPLEFETVIVNKQVSLGNVAKTIGVKENALKDLNPELRYKILPGDSYNLRVPPGHGEMLLSQLDRIPVSRPPQRAYVYHRVRHGETLSVIARKYRTSVGSIMRANNMRRSNYIVAGKRLKIPQRGYKQKTVKVIPKPRDGRAVNHIVRKGDSLYIIAKQYGTTTKKNSGPQ